MLWPRVVLVIVCAATQIVMFATFYFSWVPRFGLDQGGYLGFVGWSIAFACGSFACDAVAWARLPSALPVDSVGLRKRLWLWNRNAIVFTCMMAASIAFMLLGYLLSCLGQVLPITTCYESLELNAEEMPCPSYNRDGFWASPPLQDPADTLGATMWSVSNVTLVIRLE
jgi:hypothetical protein